MTEQERNDLRQEGFIAGARWAYDTSGQMVRRTIEGEAAIRYPTADIQKGMSGRWYRVVKKARCEGGFIGLEIHSWADEAAAQIGKDGYRVIEPQDLSAVAELLRRAAGVRP